MNKTCLSCREGFEISHEEVNFLDRVSPVFGSKKYSIPEPDICPDCRQVSRLFWRNERVFYHDECDLCKKAVISIYDPDGSYTIYCNECWWSDKWNGLDYGREFDFTKPFFPQFEELLKVVPKAALLNFEVENSPYVNFTNESKNCYLTFGSGYMEDCMYLDWCHKGKDTFDSSYCTDFELCYMCVDCTDIYNCKFCQDCHNCSDCFYSFDLRNSKNCFGCVGLRGKEFYIFNESYPKEKYFEKIKELKLPESLPEIRSRLEELKKNHKYQAGHIMNSENCSGDYIQGSNNCESCFDVMDMEDSKYMFDAFGGKDCMDHNRTGKTEMTYYNVTGGYFNNVLFTSFCLDAKFALYSFECAYSQYYFGSAGLNHNKYVIFNKQYSKDEYEQMVPRLIKHMRETGEWGRFFPMEMSPFAYNESLANHSFPLSKEDAQAKGFRWKDPDKKDYKPQTCEVPANIDDVPDTITKEILVCEESGRNFKITPQELAYYRREGIPIPRFCPDVRYKHRLQLKNPRKLWDRKCDKCAAEIKTTYSPDRSEKVYCEACYLKAVY